MTIRAGRLDTRVSFQSSTDTADGGGGWATSWTTRFTVWGGFTFPRFRSRMEQIAAGVVTTEIAGELVVRDSRKTRLITRDWRAVVTTDPTVSPATQETWNIRKVYPYERDGFIRMEVEAGVPT